jgi:3-methyl-2-oxobutanoate hydroxymethyltransferase
MIDSSVININFNNKELLMNKKKLTVRDFRKMREARKKIVALTAYDAPTAKFAEKCGVDLILVGDSLGMTVLGYKHTLSVTIDESLHHCKAVVRGVDNAFVVGDMPFMTYHPSEETALKNAARYLQEGGVDAVKFEGGKIVIPIIKRLVNAGVPVLAHIGLLPQNVLTSGGYRIAGKTSDEASRLIDDAKAIEDAGAFGIVLEGIPAHVSAEITSVVSVPTIGIGAGIECSGQIQVISDILGLFSEFTPKHAKRYANLDKEISNAITEYVADVRQSTFPSEKHSF